MRYIIYMPCQLACMLLCYLTNWLVVLFASEEGELPGLLRMWQTWDDTLDNRTDVDRMPTILRYDWDTHYIQEHRMECGQIRYTERLIKPFSLGDRIRRYCCRVHWLYRNCAYGFAFYLFGATVWPQQYPIQTKNGDGWYFCRSGLVWAYKNEARITGRWYWKIYLGWKLQRTMQTDYQAMIATRLWFSRKQQSLRGRPPGALFFLQKIIKKPLTWHAMRAIMQSRKGNTTKQGGYENEDNKVRITTDHERKGTVQNLKSRRIPRTEYRTTAGHDRRTNP